MTVRFPVLSILMFGLSLLVPTQATAQRGADSVLFLAVQRGGKVDVRLSHAFFEHLTKSGESLIKENALLPPERQCSNEECYSQLASREGAKVVLSAQTQDAGAGRVYMTVSLFDADGRTTIDEKTLCERCSGPQLSTALFDLGDRLLLRYREQKAVQAAQQPAQSAAPPANAASEAATNTNQVAPAPLSTDLAAPRTTDPGDFFSRWSRNRKIAAGVLSGLLIATLIPTVALHVTDGSETSLIGCTSAANFCVLQNKPIYAAGYAISGALAIGLAITFAWPSPKPASANQTVQYSLEGK